MTLVSQAETHLPQRVQSSVKEAADLTQGIIIAESSTVLRENNRRLAKSTTTITLYFVSDR